MTSSTIVKSLEIWEMKSAYEAELAGGISQ